LYFPKTTSSTVLSLAPKSASIPLALKINIYYDEQELFI